MAERPPPRRPGTTSPPPAPTPKPAPKPSPATAPAEESAAEGEQIGDLEQLDQPGPAREQLALGDLEQPREQLGGIGRFFESAYGELLTNFADSICSTFDISRETMSRVLKRVYDQWDDGDDGK
jgi:hypothetical protein